MRSLLVAVVMALTALTFFLAARFTSSNAEILVAEQDAQNSQLVQTQAALATEFARLQQAGTALEAQITTVTSERDALAADLAAAQANAAETSAALAAYAEQVAEVSPQTVELEAQFAESQATIAALNATVAEKDAEMDLIVAQMAALQDGAVTAAARIAELETGTIDAAALPVSTDEQVLLLQKTLDERDAVIADLETTITDLTPAADATEEAAALVAKVDELTATVAEREAAIASLETQLAETGDAPSEDTLAEIAALTAAVAERDAAIATLEAAQAEAAATGDAGQQDAANAEIETLTATLAEREAAIAALEAQVAEAAAANTDEDITALVAEREAQIAALDTQVSNLSEQVNTQSSTIEMLRLGLGDEPMEADELAKVCMDWARAFLETSQITFSTGTTTISDSSVPTLERLRDLAIGCKNEGLMIEIGGHTDSQGGEADNQRLSETRAKAVLDYMVRLGVDADTMQAVGYGEADPIATNDTNEGRAANRRITFEWKLMTPAEEPIVETRDAAAMDAIDGVSEAAEETAPDAAVSEPTDETVPATAEDAVTDPVDQ